MVGESLTFECFILCYQIKINSKTKGIGWLGEGKKKICHNQKLINQTFHLTIC